MMPRFRPIVPAFSAATTSQARARAASQDVDAKAAVGVIAFPDRGGLLGEGVHRDRVDATKIAINTATKATDGPRMSKLISADASAYSRRISPVPG